MNRTQTANFAADEENSEVWISQRTFFTFIYKKLGKIKVFTKTEVMTDEQWFQDTCSTSSFSIRGKDLRAIDQNLQEYHDFRRISNRLIKTSLILCTDESRVQTLISKFEIDMKYIRKLIAEYL